MEGILNFASIVIVVFGILQIILFFKLWGMTSDIRAIKNKYIQSSYNKEDTLITQQHSVNKKSDAHQPIKIEYKFAIGDVVLDIRTGKQMTVIEIDEDSDRKYNCYSNNGTTYEGAFEGSEITLLS